MALSDIWKLKDYIKESFRDAAKGRAVGWDDLLNPDNFKSVGGAFNPFLGQFKMLEDAAKAGLLGDKLKEYTSAIDGSTIPPHAKFVLNLLLPVLGALPIIMQSSNIQAEPNIFRPLRKSFRPTLADAQSYIEASRRSLIDGDKALERLRETGYSEEDITMLKKLAFSVPSSSDIVSFAVREAYDEEVVRLFGQDDNIDVVLKNSERHRAQAGLSEDLFRFIWRTHWQLPSTLQGFEMLHRDVITDKDLDILLRAKDVMPFWREKLKAISFSPFTRVDVRRMHKLGILGPEDIVRAYKDIGYAQDKAEKMRDFTIEFNKDPEENEQTNTDKLRLAELNRTRNNIVKSYEDGHITKETLKELLTQTELKDEIIQLIIERVDYERERDLLNDLIRAYRDLFVKGLATESEIKSALAAIPVPTESINRLFESWSIIKASRLDLPTKAEILRFFKKELITETKARELLTAIGTQDEFLDLYIQDAQK